MYFLVEITLESLLKGVESGFDRVRSGGLVFVNISVVKIQHLLSHQYTMRYPSVQCAFWLYSASFDTTSATIDNPLILLAHPLHIVATNTNWTACIHWNRVSLGWSLCWCAMYPLCLFGISLDHMHSRHHTDPHSVSSTNNAFGLHSVAICWLHSMLWAFLLHCVLYSMSSNRSLYVLWSCGFNHPSILLRAMLT